MLNNLSKLFFLAFYSLYGNFVMNKKYLLSSLSAVIITALSCQSMASGSFSDLQDELNAQYPEHTHDEELPQSEVNLPDGYPTDFNSPVSPQADIEPISLTLLRHEQFANDRMTDLDWNIQKNKDAVSHLTDSVDNLNSDILYMQTLQGIQDKSQADVNKTVNALNKKIDNNNIAIEKQTADQLNKQQKDITALVENVEKSNLSHIADHQKQQDAINANIENITKQQSTATANVDKVSKQQHSMESSFKRMQKQQTEQFSHLDSKINQTARDANAGIASVAAMSNIPYITGNRFSVGLGAGNFKNGKAVAAGAQYQIKQNLNVRSSISWNNSDSAVIGAGIAYGW